MPYDSLTTRADSGPLIPDEVIGGIIKSLPQNSVVMARARRARMARGQARMPALSALAQAYFVGGDTGLKQTTKQAWANRTLVAEEIAALVPVPQAVIDDVDFDLWDEVKPSLEEAAGQLIDLAVLFGVGKPATWGPAIVPGAAAAGNSFVRGSVAGQALWEDVLSTAALVAADGHPVTGFASDAMLEFALLGMKDDNGRPVFLSNLQSEGNAPQLLGRPISYLNNGGWDPDAADLIAGDWTQGILAVRQDITFTTHTEGVISDDDGAVILNLMQQDSAALRMVLRVAWQVANPVTRRQSVEANRFPWAILRPTGFV
jgi:HK97 family phage major capsid protein